MCDRVLRVFVMFMAMMTAFFVLKTCAQEQRLAALERSLDRLVDYEREQLLYMDEMMELISPHIKRRQDIQKEARLAKKRQLKERPVRSGGK